MSAVIYSVKNGNYLSLSFFLQSHSSWHKLIAWLNYSIVFKTNNRRKDSFFWHSNYFFSFVFASSSKVAQPIAAQRTSVSVLFWLTRHNHIQKERKEQNWKKKNRRRTRDNNIKNQPTEFQDTKRDREMISLYTDTLICCFPKLDYWYTR